jgi:membrane-bound metal-dependent hydrolase YbcI (DUF457 family)
MPDLVTHLASALVPGAAMRLDRAALLALGTALPDLAGRVPGLFAGGLYVIGVPVPSGIEGPFGALHLPVGATLASLMLAFALPERDRPVGAALLTAGALMHLLLDVMQDHRGYGSPLFFPLSTVRIELGWFGPEATVPYAPAFAAVAAVAWGLRAWWASRRRGGEGAGARG